jgi:hypothetical protein
MRVRDIGAAEQCARALRSRAVALPLDVPELVRQRAISNGVEGRRWLVELPEMVPALAEGLEHGEFDGDEGMAFLEVATRCL